MENLICSRCGRENITEGARFCAYCGGELLAETTQAAPELCRKIRDIYADYINWSAEFMANRKAGQILSALFTGDTNYKTRQEHGEFAERCKAAAEELHREFEAGNCDRREVMDLLSFVLVKVYGKSDDQAGWMLLAAEKFFLPFIDGLTAAEAGELYGPYKAQRKKKPGFGVQEEISKKLKKLSK